MKFLLLIFFAGYTVRCDDSNYIIPIPSEDLKRPIGNPFKVYWNVPTFECEEDHNITLFKNLLGEFGIIQNMNDNFRGDKIAILYDPGSFPAYVKDEISGELDARNGAVPQEGNLDDHLSSFRNNLNQSIPHTNFSGVGVIDFEAWRPVFRQHWSPHNKRYMNLSREIENKRHGREMNESVKEKLAEKHFEKAARDFMEKTLLEAKKMRPNAQWGYYGFPYCFNSLQNNIENCSKIVTTENERISWLWSESTALFPSVYSSKKLWSYQLELYIRGRVSEAARVRQNGAPILPYFSYYYAPENEFLSQNDLETALNTFYKSEASGFIIWGSSNDVKTKEKCFALFDYIKNIMGPAIKKYTIKDNVSSHINSLVRVMEEFESE